MNADVPFTVDLPDAYAKLLNESDLETSVAAAFAYTQDLFSDIPAAGRKCSLRTPETLRAIVADQIQSVLLSGTLGYLNLATRAVSGSHDVGRCGSILQSISTPGELADAMGVIVINLDVWADEEFANLSRANKDAEILAACLVCWWH